MKFIGMVHLKALPGYPQHKGMDYVIKNAIEDAIALKHGGADAILVENCYDDPHTKIVGPEIISAVTLVIERIKNKIDLPIGICMLWNDYKSGLAIAKVTGCQFVRIPVFTDTVVTASGIIEANPYGVISYRDKIKGNGIVIMADVHVKYSGLVVKRDIVQCVKEALNFKADEIIITGKHSTNMPEIQELARVRENCPDTKIVIGSGVSIDNINELSKYADRFIIGESIKTDEKIDIEKVRNIKNKINTWH